LLEGEKISELACGSFPYRCGIAEITVLLEQRHAKPRLARYGTGRWCLLSGYEPKECCLAGSVASDDSPSVTLRRCERNVGEECGRTELDRCT
jgi:hypothetical protein